MTDMTDMTDTRNRQHAVTRLQTIVGKLDDQATSYETALSLIDEANGLYTQLPLWQKRQVWPVRDMPKPVT